MSRKIYLPVVLLVMFTLLLGACSPAPVVEPVVEVPTAVVVVEEPVVEPTEAPVVVEAPDFQALFTEIIGNTGKEKSYSTMPADTLNTELIENPDLFLIFDPLCH